MFHYTDKDGWNGIRLQKTWRFTAEKPPAKYRPIGAYFTDIEPTETNLKTLYKRIRVPKAKQEYVFKFTGVDGLRQIEGGRGRERHIFYSATDYDVVESRQQYEGPTAGIMEKFE